LKNPKWQALGIGPTCYANPECNSFDRAFDGDVAALPFNKHTRDIVCKRVEGRDDTVGGTTLHRVGETQFNIVQRYKHHSPSGMEWGYAGSGPADFALNILALFDDQMDRGVTFGEYETLWDGQKVHPTVYRLHQRFKRDFIATLPYEGGTIHGYAIMGWLAVQQEAIDVVPV
jgi:hypothetical protein